jgi:hypothetical protein
MRDSLRASLLGAFSDQYKESNETWRALDAKAQATTTVSGIFLAAAFAYAREIGSLSDFQRWLLVTALLFLLTSVALCLLALRIQEAVAPPLGTFVATGILSLTRLDVVPTEEALDRFFQDRVKEWREAIGTVSSRNARKASLVWFGQLLLGLAMLPVAIFTVIRVVA